MTLEELEQTAKKMTFSKPVCDPCQTITEHKYEDGMVPDISIMVNELGQAKYMRMTQDGRYIPLEDW